ncbi:sialidase family protein [Saccharopolyspora pogona]|uniref:sialidase family protein n=1 Tax=Saccharopolyspora pogona TaxID=333966 RepID=UPI001CC22E02|nr:sialidase family protein [Saccharopolyspora pogona]
MAISGTTIFTKGEGGYNCFRIPAPVRTQDRSTLLVFAEGRHNNCDDADDIDVCSSARRTTGRRGDRWNSSPTEPGTPGATRCRSWTGPPAGSRC